jgi:hypothetical protein
MVYGFIRRFSSNRQDAERRSRVLFLHYSGSRLPETEETQSCQDSRSPDEELNARSPEYGERMTRSSFSSLITKMLLQIGDIRNKYTALETSYSP